MDVLKKIRAATLTEALVAAAIIMTIFLIASMSLNNVFQNTSKKNKANFENRLREVTYLVKNAQITLPFYEENTEWEIAIERKNTVVVLEATHLPSNTQSIKTIED